MSSVRPKPKSLAAILQENPKALAMLQKDFAHQLKPRNGGGNRFFNSMPADILLADVGASWLQEYRTFLTTFKVNANWYNEYGSAKDLPKAFANPKDSETYKMFINKIVGVALDVILDENANLDLAWIDQLDPQHKEQQLASENENLIVNLVFSYLERVSLYLKHGSVDMPAAKFEMGKLGVAQAMEMLFNQFPQDIIDFIRHKLAIHRGAEFHAAAGVVGLRPLTINTQAASTPKSTLSTSASSKDDDAKHHFAFTPSVSQRSGSLSSGFSGSDATPSSRTSTPGTPHTPDSSRSLDSARARRGSVSGQAGVPSSIPEEDSILPGSLMAHYAMFYKPEPPAAKKADDAAPANKLKKGAGK